MTADGAGEKVLCIAGQPVLISLADVEDMRRALITYLAGSSHESRKPWVQELESNIPEVDPDGELRVGGWLLEAREANPVLSTSSQTGNVLRVDVASMRRGPHGAWQVAELSYEIVRPL